MSTKSSNDRIFIPLIAVLSVVIPLAVAYLIFAIQPDTELAQSVAFLPTLNAMINSTVTVLLILGLVFIRRKQIKLHRATMMSALVLSTCFLISYVIYHYAVGDSQYRGEGLIKVIYIVILASHIVLSMVVVPLALLAVYRGINNEIEKHRKIVKWAWPIWLYVSVTGVVVYLMVHVYNPV